MSIIYEALQKVERSKEGTSLTRPETIDQVIAARNPKPKNNKILFFLLFTLLLVAAVFVVPNHSIKPSGKNPVAADKSKISEKRPIQNTQTSIAEPKTQKEDKIPAGAYLLQGIIYDKEVPQAVINGKNLKVSDSIDDFQVKEITPNSVKIVNPKDNNELTLSF